MTRHILLSNDDGIEAHGLNLLARVLAERGDVRVSVVAPSEQQSARALTPSVRSVLDCRPPLGGHRHATLLRGRHPCATTRPT
jgi:broad specificity polyphosphatase/5'/3'-nucleotidase SurE